MLIRELFGDRVVLQRNLFRIMDQLFPRSLEGASVLEVGCGEGLFCFEAKRRNAGRVVGIDIDDERLAAAAKLARENNWDIEFIPGSVMDVEELGMFDYVLCRDLPHRFLDPIHTIHKLIGITRQKLILELEDVDLRTTKFAKKRPRQALLGGWRPLFKLLPYALRPGILVVDSHGRFLMTRQWIKNLLRTQRRDIDRIEIFDSDQPHRYLLVAFMRHLRALSLVSGPSGIGKSELLRRLNSRDSEVTRLFDLERENAWQAMIALDLDQGAEVATNKLILEYSMGRPLVRSLANYEDDPALTIMRVAQAKRVYILVCPRDLLITRLQARGRPKSRPRAKAERLIHEYSRPGGFQKLYEKWISHCKANRWEITYVDVSSRQVKPVPEGEALQLISHDPQRAYHHS